MDKWCGEDGEADAAKVCRVICRVPCMWVSADFGAAALLHGALLLSRF